MDNFGTQEKATWKYVGEPHQTYLGPTTLSSPNSLPPNSRIRHFRMGLASFSSKFTVCSPLLVSPLRRRQKMRSDPQLPPPLLPTDRQTTDGRADGRANGSPRLQRPLPTQSDRRLTFGSYAAASERKSVTSLGGNGKRHRGMDGGCGSFYGSLKPDRGRGEMKEMNRICVAIRARPRAKSARVSLSGC